MSNNNDSQATQEQFMAKMDAFIGALTDLMNKGNTTETTGGAASARLKLPDSYDGTRDAVLIERWIAAIERHMNFYQWNNVKTMQFATTLLTNDADTWYRALEASGEDAPKDWLELKRLLVEAFKPPNAKTLARECLRACVQTGSIQQYVNEFQNIKLSLPKMTEEEACDRFVAGLADDQLVAQLRNVDEDELTLRMAFNMALSYEAARRPRVLAPTPSAHQQPQPTVSTPVVDDPMDLDAVQGRASKVKGCFYCGKVGHVRDNCRVRERDIKALEQKKYNNLVRNGPQQGNNRGGKGFRSGRGRYNRGSANTTETCDSTSGGDGQCQRDEQDF